ncbi:MAG: hypothetical protein ACI9MC_000866, partial [Kiritimatiellia bacterium]
MATTRALPRLLMRPLLRIIVALAMLPAACSVDAERIYIKVNETDRSYYLDVPPGVS